MEPPSPAPHTHLGEQQQGAAGLGVCVLVSEVKQLRCEDGGCKEPQKEEAAGCQVLHILPENHRRQLGKLRQQTLGAQRREKELGQKAYPSLPRRVLLSASVSLAGKWNDRLIWF